VLEREFGRVAAKWTYRDAQGQSVGIVARWNRPDGEKDIRPISLRAGGWRIKAMPAPRPLYNLPALATADLVVVCEGELCADTAGRLGFVATTSSHGSGAASKTDWTPLSGKAVWLFPDNDSAGQKYVQDVASLLSRLPTPPREIRIVELPGLPDSGDIVDWVASHGDSAEPEAMRQEIESLAQGAELWQPDDMNAHNDADGLPDGVQDLEYRPFPVQALPSPVRDFVDAGARAIGVDAAFVALPLLAALGAAIGNTRRLRIKPGWLAPPIIWTAVVSEPGGGKTPAARLALRLVLKRQKEALARHSEAMKKFRADYRRWEKELSKWRRKKDTIADPPEQPEPPQAERFLIADTTTEAVAPILQANPRGVLLHRDELRGWLGSFDRYAAKGRVGSDAAFWLSCHTAEPAIIDRKTTGTVYVAAASVCISGGIQPGTLRRALGTEHIEDGLAGRLLFAMPPRKIRRWSEEQIDLFIEEAMTQVFDRLYGLQPASVESGEFRPAIVRLSQEAKTIWMQWFDEHAVEVANATGALAAALAKIEESPARLGLVVHYVRWAAGDVQDELTLDGDSMRAGVMLAEWFRHEAQRLYGALAATEGERELDQLVEWIANRGGRVTAREVQTYYWKLKAPGRAASALEELVQGGFGSWQNAPATPNGGRPARVFALATPQASAETSQGKPSAKLPGIQGFSGSADAEVAEGCKTDLRQPATLPSGADGLTNSAVPVETGGAAKDEAFGTGGDVEL
jgi:hypothetical protein